MISMPSTRTLRQKTRVRRQFSTFDCHRHLLPRKPPCLAPCTSVPAISSALILVLATCVQPSLSDPLARPRVAGSLKRQEKMLLANVARENQVLLFENRLLRGDLRRHRKVQVLI